MPDSYQNETPRAALAVPAGATGSVQFKTVAGRTATARLPAARPAPTTQTPTEDRPSCPCCGQIVQSLPGVLWDLQARILVGGAGGVTLGPIAAKLFDAVWKIRLTGVRITGDALALDMWGCQPRHHRSRVSQRVDDLNRAIALTGFTIDSERGHGGGYRLRDAAAGRRARP